MKKIISLIIILLVLPLICLAKDFANPKVPNSEEQPLQFTILSDKESYLIGDEIKLICIIENVSNKEISFYRDPLARYCKPLMRNKYTDNWCHTHCYWVLPEEYHREKVTLMPKQKFEYSFKGRILIGEGRFRFSKGFKGTMIFGLIIDFGTTSKYLEDGFGEYEVYTLYVIDPGLPFEKKSQREESVILKSNIITIEVKNTTIWDYTEGNYRINY